MESVKHLAFTLAFTLIAALFAVLSLNALNHKRELETQEKIFNACLEYRGKPEIDPRFRSTTLTCTFHY